MKALRTIPLVISIFYFIISNGLFVGVLQGSGLVYAFLFLSTFPYGPLCYKIFNYLDSSVFVTYDVDKRNELRYITLYLLLVIGGALWYWILARCSCGLFWKLHNTRQKFKKT